jgi:hypothetical protein
LSVRFASLLAAAALFAGPLAMAQSAPPAEKPADITVAPVTVSAAKPKTIEKEAQSFVETYASAPHPVVDQISRWHDPVCVQVVGLPDAVQGARIKARIESVSVALGLPAAAKNCVANVEIVFTPYPQAAMDAIAKRREQMLGYFHVHNRTKLKAVTHPIEARYQTATRGEATGAVALAFSEFSEYTQQQTEVVDDPNNRAPNGCADSRLSTSCLTSLLHNVIIVADSKALEGKDLGLVADDMVMLALTEPRSIDGCNAMASVLDAFANPPCSGREPPDGLTPADAAYLTALYTSDLRAKKHIEETELATRMARILIKGSPDGK